MPNVLFRMSATPGRVDWLGPDLGDHTDEVLEQFGIDAERRARLRADGVI